MHSYDDQLYPKVAALKMQNPQLKVGQRMSSSPYLFC